MKKAIIFLLFLLAVGNGVFAHNLDYADAVPRSWDFNDGRKSFEASYLMGRDGRVFLENPDGKVHSFSIESLCAEDRNFVEARLAKAAAINQAIVPPAVAVPAETESSKMPWFAGFLGLILLLAYTQRKTPLRALASQGLVTVSLAFLPGFRTKEANSIQISDPVSMDSAFAPFKPDVYTRWDNNWFYVESKGIPKHEMMTGITAWQRQVPIQQCYTVSNAWQIPINPVMAVDPIPVNPQHFSRGGIAVAVNGIAIFNPFTNTGVDALVDGQLDNWGGHTGRADDYHYHTAPLHLYAQSNPSFPIAYGFDGFPVFGSTEPDGAPMETLDANHGHLRNGKYHYHGTTAYPYMIGKMAGVVTEDSTHQIIPQSRAKPVRPAGTPLTGAAITGFQTFPGGRSYAMYYTLAGANYAWIYSWNQAVTQYTFRYCTPTDTTTTNYQGPGDCFLPLDVKNRFQVDGRLRAWPNPVASGSLLNLSAESLSSKQIRSLRLISSEGKTVLEQDAFSPSLSLRNVRPGVYLLEAGLCSGDNLNQRIIVR